MCDAGATEGELTHFILAVTSLIWTVVRAEWENGEGDYFAYVRTEESEKKPLLGFFSFS